MQSQQHELQQQLELQHQPFLLQQQHQILILRPWQLRGHQRGPFVGLMFDNILLLFELHSSSFGDNFSFNPFSGFSINDEFL